MRLENLQTEDADGKPQIRRMTEALPHRLFQGDNQIELKASWFSGCTPLGILFLAIASVQASVLVSHLETSRIDFGVVIAALLIVGQFLLAIWLLGKKTSVKIDVDEIKRRKSLALFSHNPMCWSSEQVTKATIVEQGTFTIRFQMLAPGIILETKSGPIDLGAHGDKELVEEIAEAIASLLEVPLEDKTREGIFAKFRSGRLKLFLIALGIAAILIALRWWFEHR